MGAKLVMEIRPAQENDISAIVELLKLSLGESLMPKSEAFWRWKHSDNPFGQSPVLLAVEGSQVIGVRAFVRWAWKQGDQVYRAVRAVDTATHPEHQGKGIFKKLTLQLVEQCKQEGIDFVFNTPNKSSKPGYLKMGWLEVGRLPITVYPRLPFNGQAAEFINRYQIETVKLREFLDTHPQLFTARQDKLTTHVSKEFILWRYGCNPNIRYCWIYDPKGTYALIFRLKPNRLGIEFRTCDVLTAPGFNRNDFRQEFSEAIRLSGAFLLTCSGAFAPYRGITLPIGPVVTQRPLNEKKSLSFAFWKPSLGDLEVF
ncbi:MAG: GNAT family N-acetyltransferase [Cyclobacteriaceae bacterium]|nr:GNAT family N-acetyltransferase [Cyclobacteriaceae bacterium]